MLKRFTLLVHALLLLGSVPAPVTAEQTAFTRSIEQLLGENYLYSIDFLFFSNIAIGELHFVETPRPGVFRAELVGRTVGVASWVTGERTQTYTSFMEQSPEGSLRTIEYTSRIVKHRWGTSHIWERRYLFNYEEGKIYAENTIDNLTRTKSVHDLPVGRLPVDFLAALYNLRTGAYGPLSRGVQLSIPTYSGGKFSVIQIEVLSLEQQVEQHDFPSGGFLVQVKVDPEIFDTGSGNMYVWFDDTTVPRQGILEDLIGIGDIRGRERMEGS
jgi:hypothetical protein